jgi:hypothetical protein
VPDTRPAQNRATPAGAPATARAGGLLAAAFGTTLFASAFLLFWLEPLVSRLVLPSLGGSPLVWNTCVFFFQVTLLAGYGYAHVLAKRLPLQGQLAAHALLLAAALASLPLALGTDARPASADPVAWLLALLAEGVGLPFLCLAATAPLLQAWFARTAHPHAADPYFLYAASNAGSLVALLAYPVLLEAVFDLSDQTRAWSAGFAAACCAVAACAAILAATRDRTAAAVPPPPHSPIHPRQALRWLGLSFVPSGLMLAVTTHITTDVASAPLFWVVPLAIYILTFVLAFARGRPARLHLPLRAQAVALAAAGAAGFAANLPIGQWAAWAVLAALPLAAFTLTAAVCHMELARSRPATSHLTAFFLIVSAGGALGGLFNVLVAPVLFDAPLEYPLLLAAACLLRPPPPDHPREDWAKRGDLLLPALLAVTVTALLGLKHPAAQPAAAALALSAMLWFSRRRVRLAFALGYCLLAPVLVSATQSLSLARSFFGIYRVYAPPGRALTVLAHGSTVHGVESTAPGERLEPMGYYHRAGPFGRLFAVLDRRPAPPRSIGLIGLGVGTLACYARPGQTWTFREIDPLIEAIARDQRWFHYLAECGNSPEVVIGDARLTLQADTGARYDLLVVDAFSSDSVPVHLITREALALYLARLRPNGLVAVHVSNRYLDLAPVVARLALDAGAPVRHLSAQGGPDPSRQSAASLVLIGAPGTDMTDFAKDGWDAPPPGTWLWTDQRSSILPAMRWR